LTPSRDLSQSTTSFFGHFFQGIHRMHLSSFYFYAPNFLNRRFKKAITLFFIVLMPLSTNCQSIKKCEDFVLVSIQSESKLTNRIGTKIKATHFFEVVRGRKQSTSPEKKSAGTSLLTAIS
jgi:hypothetical protein